MAVCTDVKHWIEEHIQVPVERAVEQAVKSCTEYKRRIEREVKKPVERWVSRQERKCKKRKWYDPRRWLCTIVNTLIKVVTWVVVLVVEWVPYLVCKIVTFVVKIVVAVVVRVLKFVVVFAVCLFTDPLGALRALGDLWNDLLDIVQEIVEFLKSLVLEDVSDLITDGERLTDSIGCGFGQFGMFFGGIVRWVTGRTREASDLAHELVNNLLEVLLGALSLNWCRVVDGLAGTGADILRAIAWALGIPFGAGGAVRDSLQQHDLEEIVESALERARDQSGRPFDEEAKEAARDRLGFGGCPFGLPITLEPCRFYISSRSDDIDLRQLHNDGVLNLYDVGGLLSGCGGFDAFTGDEYRRRLRGELVFVDTKTPVGYNTIKVFLEDGPGAVPEFGFYAIPLAVFDRYLKLARRKGFSVGLDFSWQRIQDIEWHPIQNSDAIGTPDSGSGQSVLFPEFGRIGLGADICVVPTFAVFRYINNIRRSGFASMFPSVVSNVRESGVTFRYRPPEFFFRWVPIHEIGHYFSLLHDGHDGLHHIMWTPDPGANLDTWTSETTAELFLSGLEPRFTREDTENIWNWIIVNAKECLFEEDVIE